MKPNNEKDKKYFKTFVNITFTFDLKLSVNGDADEWDAKYRAEEILNDLIANGEIIVVNSDTSAVRGNITDVDVEADSEITKEEFDAAPGKPDLHLGSHFKLN
jgi:sulfur carrier protein ThiS